jgi:UDP-glucose 4-epimerase
MSSGGTVYGVTAHSPVDEGHPTNPICSYGINKLAIEKYLNLYSHLYGLDFIVLRAANPYGRGQNPLKGQGIIANLVHKMMLGEPLEIWGDGTVVRDYFDVRDLASLTLKALFSENCGVFNAGSGVGLSIHDLIKVVAKNFSITPDVIFSEERKLDVNSIILNCAKARETFGWKASADINLGVADYISWYSKNFLD